ncbi:hypothetical protein CI610_01120 [invertebrate metagenome]|uniref:Uncharacterized protein n=1 Tax=invertebrate metagenome TaxID=1711999 RepID=A0A2H9T9I7_9ZZZZ
MVLEVRRRMAGTMTGFSSDLILFFCGVFDIPQQ